MYYTEKVASTTAKNDYDRRQCEDMMNRIYEEDPSKWPHGLDMYGFDGGCYMVREASTGKPIGFTGWQEKRADNGRKIGYYSIGILPEYRRNGFAKAAVRKLLSEKSAGVHRVEAFIAPDNKASLGLADVLGVDVVMSKAARLNWSAIRQAFLPAVGGGGLTEVMDRNAGDGNFFGDLAKSLIPGGEDGNMDSNRLLRGASNFGSGVLGGFGVNKMRSGLTGVGEKATRDFGIGAAGVTAAVPSAGATDAVLNSIAPINKLGPALDKFMVDKPTPAGMSDKAKLIIGLLAGGTALGAGVLAHKRNKALEAQADAVNKQHGGRVNLTLPTKDPTDAETTIDIPIEDINLSNNIKNQLGRDTRRRLRQESNSRTKKRKAKKKVSEEEDSKIIGISKAAQHIQTLRKFEKLLA